MKKQLLNYCGLLGIISLISYTCAVFISPLAYPHYNAIKQAVSDLSAINAPSFKLWNILSTPYNLCTLVCATCICIGIKNLYTRRLRTGIYLFTLMEWISALGFNMFPLTESGYAGTFQDIMHLIITGIVVLLSIVSLIIIISSRTPHLSFMAFISLIMMLIGALGMNIVSENYFGIVERFSVFGPVIYNAVLGLFLYHHNFIDK